MPPLTPEPNVKVHAGGDPATLAVNVVPLLRRENWHAPAPNPIGKNGSVMVQAVGAPEPVVKAPAKVEL